MLLSLLLSLLFVPAPVAPPPQFGAPGPPVHAQLSLLAERTVLRAGHGAVIGLRFRMDPGWHIYWRNPGDSGAAPAVTWDLPAGYKAGDFEWPVPQRIEVAGLVNYGYEGTVLLPVTVTVPPGAAPGKIVTLAAGVKYLICKDVCMPGRARVSLTLPVAEDRGEASDDSPLFDAARARLPQPAPASLKARATLAGREFRVTIETGRREATGMFFPVDESRIDDSAPQKVTPLAAGIEFRLRASDQMTKPPAALTAVIVLPPDRAYTVRVPVSSGAR
jgi:thiol:disulfide interchange protein DsbD